MEYRKIARFLMPSLIVSLGITIGAATTFVALVIKSPVANLIYLIEYNPDLEQKMLNDKDFIDKVVKKAKKCS